MLNFVCWKWRQTSVSGEYTSLYVNTLVAALRKHCMMPHRVICVTDDPVGVGCPTFPLWNDYADLANMSGVTLPSCYRRLKIFDPETLTQMGIPMGERVVSIDLDAVLMREIGSLFTKPERFVGWHVFGTRRRTVLNGSLFMFHAGDLAETWDDFKQDPTRWRNEARQANFLGSDQAYLSLRFIDKPDTGKWTNDKDGVLSYYRDIKIRRVLPKDARIVFFPGRLKPWSAEARKVTPWISHYVRYDQAHAA